MAVKMLMLAETLKTKAVYFFETLLPTTSPHSINAHMNNIDRSPPCAAGNYSHVLISLTIADTRVGADMEGVHIHVD